MILKTYQSAAGQLPLFCRDYRMSRRSSTGCCVDGFSANGQDPFPWSTVLCHSLGRHGAWSLLWSASFLGPEVLLSSSQQVSAQLGGGGEYSRVLSDPLPISVVQIMGWIKIRPASNLSGYTEFSLSFLLAMHLRKC